MVALATTASRWSALSHDLRALPPGLSSPEALSEALRAAYYLADDGIATAAFLSLALGKPLLLEGAPASAKPRPRRRWRAFSAGS